MLRVRQVLEIIHSIPLILLMEKLRPRVEK